MSYFLYFRNRLKFPERPVYWLQGLFIMSAIALQFGLNQIEIKGTIFHRPSLLRATQKEPDWSRSGCQGAEIFLRQIPELTLPLIEVRDCGLPHPLTYFPQAPLIIQNLRSGPLHLRLFHLKNFAQGYRWKFKKIFIIPSGSQEVVAETLTQEDGIYLLKSLEDPSIGQQVLVRSLHPYKHKAFRFTPTQIQTLTTEDFSKDKHATP